MPTIIGNILLKNNVDIHKTLEMGYMKLALVCISDTRQLKLKLFRRRFG